METQGVSISILSFDNKSLIISILFFSTARQRGVLLIIKITSHQILSLYIKKIFKDEHDWNYLMLNVIK